MVQLELYSTISCPPCQSEKANIRSLQSVLEKYLGLQASQKDTPVAPVVLLDAVDSILELLELVAVQRIGLDSPGQSIAQWFGICQKSKDR